MEKRTGRYLLALLIILALNCHRQNAPGFGDNLAFYLYTDPVTDCFTCNLTALKILDGYLEKNDKFKVIIRNSVHEKNLKITLRENFGHRDFKFFESDLEIQHPSILLMKGKTVCMCLYIPNDRFLLQDTLDKCFQIFSNIHGRGEDF